MAEEYLQNAMSFAAKHNFMKATEFLWGAVAAAVKAVYALSGQTLGDHRQVIKALEKLMLKEEIKDAQRLIQSIDQLHINFYEGFVDESRFMILSKDAYRIIEILFKIYLRSKEQMKSNAN